MSANFRRFFLRGLTVLLPSVLTVWLLIAAYQFVQQRIAEPINQGVRVAWVQWLQWPAVTSQEIVEAKHELTPDLRSRLAKASDEAAWLTMYVRRQKVRDIWSRYAFPMDLIGLVVAVVLIYSAGLLLGSYIGHRLHVRGEQLLQQIPLIRQVYPAVKQITEFMFGAQDAKKVKFSRVVAVQYPREGIWSLAFVTGDALGPVGVRLGETGLTLFVPNSPTPFTGFTIAVRRADVVDLPMTVEEALQFIVSGGVVQPPAARAPVGGHMAVPAPASIQA